MVSAAKITNPPPKEPLTSLDAICRDFKWRFKKTKKTDQVVKFCRKAPDFSTAVIRACEARDANGKHHNHQSKVDLEARRKFAKKIIKAANRGALDVGNFDRLHDGMDAIKPYGIGPVTVYDVAVRVGAYLGIYPKSVYMHAGVRQGLKALEGAVERWLFDGEADPENPAGLRHQYQTPANLTDYASQCEPGMWRLDKVKVKRLPEPFRSMRADDVEDILCTYREVFDGWNR